MHKSFSHHHCEKDQLLLTKPKVLSSLANSISAAAASHKGFQPDVEQELTIRVMS